MCYFVKPMLGKKEELNQGRMSFTKAPGEHKTKVYALVYAKAKGAMCRLLHASTNGKRAPAL